MRSLKIKPYSLTVSTLLAISLIPSISNAAVVNLNANDAVGTSSFNSAGHWSNTQAPSAANDYNTAGFFMRTPGDAVTNYVFAGTSLTLGPCNTSGGINGSLLEKFSPGAGSVRFLTINNLTNSAGAMIRSGGTAGALIHILGNQYTMAGNSILQADQCIWVIDLPIVGGDSIVLTNFANNANDHVSYTATNSGFTGSLYLTGAGTSAWSLEMDNTASVPGNPSTFNPGQITFLASGQLRDTAGCAFTNSNGGFTLAANGNINTSTTTLIGERITDVTNGVSSLSLLTSSGTGTLILSNANNNYAGGTTISGGILQLGADNSIPGNAVGGDVIANATLDMNGHNDTINGLSGAGTIDNSTGGNSTLTIGANGDNGTFTGTIQNSAGTVSIVKVGAGTETFSGGIFYSGTTTVAGGTLSISSAGGSGGTPGNLVVSNGAAFVGVASSGTSLAANNVVVGTNSSLNLVLSPTAIGLNVNGTLTLQDNATNTLNFGSLTANPTAAAINAAGLSAPGSTIYIVLAGSGLQTGTFPLIKYAGTALGGIANFQLIPPPGVSATLNNNPGNHSIDVQITAIPNLLSWYGAGGTNWDLTTVNWKTSLGVDSLFRQYTNGSVVAGDAVTFDDTLTNGASGQPTNINITATFFAFPVVVNSSLPYTIAGPGGITGITSLVKSNSGSLTLLTSNSFTGGVSINDTGSLIITNNSALGASSGGVTLNGGTLQINGVTTSSRAISMPTTSFINVGTNDIATLSGVISGAANAIFNKDDAGTLVLTAKENLSSNVFIHNGTLVVDSGGSITNTSFHDVGQNNSDAATMVLRGTGAFGTTSDFNVGDLDNSAGVLNISNSATLVANAFFVGSANAAGSTASGIVNQTGGTVTEVSTAVGSFAIGGRTSTVGVGVYNMIGGTLTANAGMRIGGTGIGTLNQSGGTINALQGINIARIAGSFGTNNLNGGTLAAFNVASSTGQNAVFNFNGGTLQAAFNPPAATWFSGNIQANVLAGGAIIDASTNNVTISTPLLAGSPNGGLTKKGAGTLTLSGVNTFTGPIVNSAGILFLNSASTYSGGVTVNAGSVQMTSASAVTGPTIVSTNAVLSVGQLGSASLVISNLTLNGGASGPGATIGITPTGANNPNVPLLSAGVLTVNGTNSISLAAVQVGTLALIKYSGPLAGSGTLTNLILPQGATGFVSNDVADTTLFAVITSTGPGLVWTGTNAAALNVWNINATTNWLVNTTPTSYHQIITPGDSVTFNDVGSGTVILNTNVAPASLVISNNSKSYTFSGSGNVSGGTGLQKLGTGTAILSLSNNAYVGDTVVSNGTLQIGSSSTLPATGKLTVGSAGILELAGFNQTTAELTGSGVVDNNSGVDIMLTVGSSTGGAWAGSIQDHGGGGLALTKNGSGTWLVSGPNHFNNGASFSVQSVFNAGTTILTNGGSIIIPTVQTWVANGAGNTASIIVDGGTLAVSNNIFAVGMSNSTATLTVNNGTVVHGGNPNNAFGNANSIFIGAFGGTGTLNVNGGQVLNNQTLTLGQNAGGSGTLNLNGGLVQASAVVSSGGPAVSVANFNGGTLQASTNSGDFIQIPSSLIMSNGLVLDDGGWAVTILTGILQPGDAFNGGLIKTGAGAVYLDSANIYTGATVVTNGLLAGLGSITSPVIVGPAGSIGGGDSASMGTFTVAGSVTINGHAMMRINRDSSPTSDNLVATSITYGGSLIISNLSSSPITLTDTFQLFNPGSHTGNFTSIVGTPGAGMAYSFNPNSGVLSVVTSTIATNPTNITFQAGSGNLTLSWPADHTGWTLQSNGVSLMNSNAWFDYPPDTGSRNVNQAVIPFSNTNVFFRLKLPQ